MKPIEFSGQSFDKKSLFVHVTQTLDIGGSPNSLSGKIDSF
tara:strand:+ start:291 stop:413 length:123 start_codon:yes stop_codon:yes gene_type:complete